MISFLKDLRMEQIGEIYLAYTSFKNTVVHEPKLIKLLPVSVDTESVSADKEDTTPMNYEPAEDEALESYHT